MAPYSMDFWNVEVGSLKGWTLLKAPIILKNALDKSSQKLNFQQKKNSGRISLSPQVAEPRGSKDLYSHPSAFYFKNSKCLRPLAPFLEESEICIHRVSRRKFNNFDQLLFEVFFWYNWNFWQHSAPMRTYFLIPVHYYYLFKR